MIKADSILTCGVQTYDRRVNDPPRKTSTELIAAANISPVEMDLIMQTIARVSPLKEDVSVAAAQPIADSGLGWRRQVTLMSIAITMMNERGIMRWQTFRDYQAEDRRKRKRRARRKK